MAVLGGIELKGAKELADLLRNMDRKLAKKLFRKALREGAKVIQAAAQAKAPVDTGLTRSAIKVRAAKRQKRGRFGVAVQVGEGDYRGETFYASFLEYGHKMGKRSQGLGARSRRESRKLRSEARANKAIGKKGTLFRERQERYWASEGRRRALKEGGERKQVPPRPFMRPAFDESKEQAARKVIEALRAGIEAEARKG